MTPRENVRRGNGHGSETHCPRGHPYDETNTYVDRLGRRYCKTCQREGKRRRAREAREAEFPLVPVEIEGAA